MSNLQYQYFTAVHFIRCSSCGMQSVETLFSICICLYDISVPSNHHREKLSEEELHPKQKSCESTESELVLEWEVLEAEDSETENEPSGLVQAIVGVFHRG